MITYMSELMRQTIATMMFCNIKFVLFSSGSVCFIYGYITNEHGNLFRVWELVDNPANPHPILYVNEMKTEYTDLEDMLEKIDNALFSHRNDDFDPDYNLQLNKLNTH